MQIRTLAAALAALALTTTPVIAQAAGTAKAEVARTSTKGAKSNKLAGGAGIIVGVLAAAAVVGGIIIASDDDDEPASAG